MRNIISGLISYDEAQNTTQLELLCYESIDSMEDSLVVRLYPGEGIYSSSAMFRHKVMGDAQYAEETIGFSEGRVYEYTFDLTRVDSTHRWIACGVSYYGYIASAEFVINFTDFAQTGILLINQWQRKMMMDLTATYPSGSTYFVCYLSAAVAIPETATAGDGLAVNENNALTVELGDGLEFDEDGKIKLSDGKQVEGIAVTADSSDKVTSVAITYDDESTSTYSVTYDANDHVTSFGGIPITWS